MKTVLKNSLRIIIPIIFLIVGIVLGQDWLNLSNILNTPNQPAASVSLDATTKIKAGLMIDYGNDSIASYNNIELAKDQTVFDLLKKATTDNNIELVYNDQYKDLGVFIESINGVKNSSDTNHYWQYWVNNRFAQVAVDKHKLKNGDIVYLKYMLNQYTNN